MYLVKENSDLSINQHTCSREVHMYKDLDGDLLSCYSVLSMIELTTVPHPTLGELL